MFTSIGQSFPSYISLNVSKWALQSLHTINVTEEVFKRRGISFLSELVPAEGPGEGSTVQYRK